MTIATDKIEIAHSTLVKLKKIAKANNIREDKLISDILENGIKEMEKEHIHDRIERISKGKIKVINRDTYNPDKKSFEKLKGVIKAPPGFDPVKACREVKEGKY